MIAGFQLQSEMPVIFIHFRFSLFENLQLIYVDFFWVFQ